MKNSNEGDPELIEAMQSWADRERAALSIDLASRVIKRNADRLRVQRMKGVIFVVGTLFVLIGIGWFAQSDLARNAILVGSLLSSDENGEILGDEASDQKTRGSGTESSEQEALRRRVASVLEEMERFREEMESATEVCRSRIAIEEAYDKWYAAQRQSKIEEQAMLWFAANFPKENP